MTKQEFMLMRSTLFSSSAIEYDEFVINRQPNAMTDLYHECLLHCPRPLSHLMKSMGISLKTVAEYRIGYVDLAKLEAHFMIGENNHTIQHLKGCFTLPLFQDGQISGVYGLRYQPNCISVSEHSFVCYAEMPIYSAYELKNTVLLCDTAFDVLSLAEFGYRNGIAVLGDGISAMSLSAMVNEGIKNLMVFTHAGTDTENLILSKSLAKRYGICVYEVPLPFRLVGLGKWDVYQWQLFDKRLSSALVLAGGFNERYQA